MANEYLNLTDLAKINTNDIADRDISDLLDEAPVLAVLPADEASNGTTHKYVKQTGAPSVGFRAVNTGKENKKSADTEVSQDLKFLDASFWVDVAVADAYKNGPEAYLAREGARQLKAAFSEYEQQIFYGTGNASDGFNGLADDSNLDGASDSMVIDATGSTASTGSSVFGIRATPDLNNMVSILGNDAEIKIGDPTVQLMTDPADVTKTLNVYSVPISAYVGMQIGGLYSVARLGNLTAQSGKTLTDALIASLIALFKANQAPTHLCMSRRSLFQLQASRTATNATGAPAPIPQESHGIPIVVTDSIIDTETILA